MDEVRPVAGPSTSSNLQAAQRRKFSFPAALHSTLLGLNDSSQDSSGSSTQMSARRRFSNVSDAVSRKLSHTLGT